MKSISVVLIFLFLSSFSLNLFAKNKIPSHVENKKSTHSQNKLILSLPPSQKFIYFYPHYLAPYRSIPGSSFGSTSAEKFPYNPPGVSMSCSGDSRAYGCGAGYGW